ncbi:MAG: cytochrome c peroxidase [Myxococcota bacterium]
MSAWKRRPVSPENPFNFQSVTYALAAFQRTLLSFNSPYDRFLAGDRTALSQSAQRGKELFFSEALECFHCHGGFNFTDSVDHATASLQQLGFHNTGLYNLDNDGSYPAGNQGLYEHTGDPEDKGRFRAPTLRNIAVTGPYMHDGSIATLGEVIDHYAAGGRTLTGTYAGVGAQNPHKSGFVAGFEITPEDKAALVAFLEALTDAAFLSDPRFANPFGPRMGGKLP